MDTTYIHGLCLVLFSFFMSGFCLFIFSFPLFALLTAARGIPAAVAALAPNYFIIITFFFSSHLFSWAAWLGGRVFSALLWLGEMC